MKHYKKILSGLSILILSLIMTSGIVFADSEVPAITSLTFYGNVDVSGSSNPDEYYIKARIDDWESQPVVIGEFKTSMFHGLFTDAPKEYIGQTIEFVLQNQIVADQTEIFLYKNSDNTTASVWTLPQLRKIDLTFASTPLPPTPTPTLVPTATPAPIILKPSYFEGRAISNGKTVRDGVEIYAVLDDYVSEPVVVYDGRYFLTIDPILEKYLDEPLMFYIADIAASQTEPFVDDLYRSDYLLVFPTIPEATPVPTEVPTPTSTPEPLPTETPIPTVTPIPSVAPTRTATATPIPTLTSTSTPTPTPILDLAATVTAQNLLLEQIALNSESEEGGGFCSANSDGTGSLGIIGLLLSPMILYGIKKIRRIK